MGVLGSVRHPCSADVLGVSRRMQKEKVKSSRRPRQWKRKWKWKRGEDNRGKVRDRGVRLYACRFPLITTLCERVDCCFVASEAV